MEEIDFPAIEKKWQDKWESAKIFEVNEDPNKKKYYVLEMFPYPSGSGLHMGHAWNYTIGDILARFKIMNGFNVLHPMGYDSLGLPAENAAIQAGEHPEDYTNKSIPNFIKQQKAIGLSYDWSRMLSSHNPDYYKWDQWIFLKMFEKELAYQKTSAVNWCPDCNTVLANEQVHDGKCWRHENTNVEVKQLKQWFLKITNYADELYENLDNMNWPDRTKAMQKNWIGKSYGTQINFEINGEQWPIFTTRPDTIFGVTFMVVSAQHPKLEGLITKEERESVNDFLKKLKSVSEKDVGDLEKEGVFTGSYAVNPATGMEVPVYAGNFVVADYGSGMVMAVPAHDQRDFEFAKKMNNIYGKTEIWKEAEIKIVFVVCPRDENDFENFQYVKDYSRIDGIGEFKDVKLEGNSLIWSGKNGKIIETTSNYAKRIRKEIINGKFNYVWKSSGELINSKQFDRMRNTVAKKTIRHYLADKGYALRGEKTNFKLRDWGISRQRYWGTPIPIIHCKECGAVPVPENELPIKLPHDIQFGKGNPLETSEEWLNVKCPKCGGKGKRESDTMDTFVNSSWYFLRFCDPSNNKKIFDEKKVRYWCPVDTYIGGAEHACMHLIYSRFYVKFLRDLGLINFGEPATRLFHQGMLRAEGGEKMSKSKGNVVLPETISDKYGIDTGRFFLSGLASPDKDIDWDENGINGSLKFIKKVVSLYKTVKIEKDSEEILSKLNKTIKDLTEQLDKFDYRTSTIRLKELFDLITKEGEASKETLMCSLKLLNPFCPHITEELWEKLGCEGFVSNSSWPQVDESKIEIKKEIEDINSKIIQDINYVLGKLEKETSNVYLYAMPFEIEKIDSDKIAKKIGKVIKVFAVNDSDRYDPEKKTKKSKPGKPSIYLE